MYQSWCIVSGLCWCSAFFVAVVGGYAFLRYGAPFISGVEHGRQPQSHDGKVATPTMAGLLFCVAATGAWLFFGGVSARTMLMFGATAAFALLGACDDLCKIWYTKGITDRKKFCAQAGIGLITALIWYCMVPGPFTVHVPAWGAVTLGWYGIFWAAWIIVATTNAVNLTDGLDGLAALVASSVIIGYTGIAALTGNMSWDICVANVSMLGALAGFLWHNSYPATMFMGDAGSLALGAYSAMLALVARREILLPIVASVCVAEVISVMLQVTFVRRCGRRLFRMAPLHHHYELSGMHEQRVVSRFTLVAVFSAVVGCMLACF